MRKGLSDLDGRTAVVTGAASGIGRALARQLRARGCHLALVDRDHAGLDAIEHELAGDGSARGVSVHVADVGIESRMREVAAEVLARHGAVHLLINNAGIGFEGAFPQTGLDAWQRVIATNLWGTIHGCHVFLPHLAQVDRAHIVNLSSLFGIVAMPGQTAYCTSKFAIRGFSEALLEELRDTSIGLTLVHPGSVATAIMKTAQGDDPALLARIAEWYEAHALAPEAAARRIIAAVARGKPRLLFGPEVIFADLAKRLLPMRGNKAIVDLVIRVLGLEDMREKRRRQWQATMVDRQTSDQG